MPRLCELGGSVELLRRMRNQLVADEKKTRIDEERWNAFVCAATKIVESCSSRNLEGLVAASRELKNRLRRPSVKKELARLEARDDEGDEGGGNAGYSNQGNQGNMGNMGPEPQVQVPKKNKEEKEKGVCKCAKCGKAIEGSKGDCIEGALCTKCGMKRKDNGDKDKKGNGDKKQDIEKDDDIKSKTESLLNILRHRRY